MHFFKKRITSLVPALILSMFVAFGTLGTVLAVAAAVVGAGILALNAATTMVAMTPTIGFLVWVGRKKTTTFTKVQNITAGKWTVAAAALVANILIWVPQKLLISIVSTSVLEGVLWLILWQTTNRKYRTKRQSNIAIASGRAMDDAEVKTLSDNTDLATATTLAVFTTTKAIIAMRSDLTPLLTSEAIVVVGMTVGATMGLLYFNLCPNQTRIRRLVSQATKSEER